MADLGLLVDLNLNSITPTLVCLLLGAVLLALGITGGNIQIKEINIPAVSGVWRIISVVFGAVLLLLIDLAPLMKTSSVQPVLSGTSSPPRPADSLPAKPGTPAPAKVQVLPAATICDVEMTELARRADHPDGKYTWGSYNNDLESLEIAVLSLIDHLQSTQHSSMVRTRRCFKDLQMYEGAIHSTACSRFLGNGSDGKPLDNDPTDHCGKNFDQFVVRMNLLIAKLENSHYAVQDLDLSQDRQGFVKWFDESVVTWMSPAGLERIR